jgi:hypothetical protein
MVMYDRLVLVWYWIGLNTLDLLTTNAGFQRGLVEANAIPRLLIENFGVSGMYAWKMLFTLIFAGLIVVLSRYYRHAWLALRLSNLALALGILVNVALIVHTGL